MSPPDKLSQDLVGEFVQAAYYSLAKVQALHQEYPALLNTRWEKYHELAIEAAGHMGQREIAEYLLTTWICRHASDPYSSSRGMLNE